VLPKRLLMYKEKEKEKEKEIKKRGLNPFFYTILGVHGYCDKKLNYMNNKKDSYNLTTIYIQIWLRIRQEVQRLRV